MGLVCFVIVDVVDYVCLRIAFVFRCGPGQRSASPLARPPRKPRSSSLGFVIDDAFSIRMLYGTSKEVSIVSPSEAVLKSFQST